MHAVLIPPEPLCEGHDHGHLLLNPHYLLAVTLMPGRDLTYSGLSRWFSLRGALGPPRAYSLGTGVSFITLVAGLLQLALS